MTKLLATCFGVESAQFEKWGLEEESGCLGAELKLVLQKSCPVSRYMRAFLFRSTTPHRRAF